jgi:hypothetical protein
MFLDKSFKLLNFCGKAFVVLWKSTNFGLDMRLANTFNSKIERRQR